MKERSVGDLMSRDPVTMPEGESLKALRDKMLENQIRHMPVVDAHNRLLGLVTHRDLLRHTLIERPRISAYVEDTLLEELRVEDVMGTEIECVSPTTGLRQAAALMLEKKYGCLPVVEGEVLVGILTEADFLRLALEVDMPWIETL